ncbi:uncharacterized protein PHACADRAFT_183061 [Phanerochaete carnosa HHB-10118-sp]|uniref:DUF6589 domain-containing protein n=1 Tax=Phanerochaete carnosa (strain HHB-10118-sp) TaxID=650164 RepID=K5X0S9_PHACS|nr:uncharacterized protein PHACADRAFT_183061 [Phanerochaete carnosa HHB-10118-sp]EKM56352.1 hypothetical protein PHACADRAFT_183061 [Phanerochaete carnosa HHB-10118-sp]
MKVDTVLAKFNTAPPLTMKDVHLTLTNHSLFHACMCHNILCIILAFGEPGFSRFCNQIAATLPHSSRCIGLHVMEIFPLPSMEIDESSNTGDAEVVDTIFRELEYNGDDLHIISTGTVKIISGDQLSISCLQSVMHNYAGHDNPKQSYLDPVFSPVFVSLYARVLHCLELVSGKSLAEYIKGASFDELEAHAALIYKRYASGATVDRMCRDRLRELRKHGDQAMQESLFKGNMVVENVILFLRSLLIFREFCDEIKVGNSGRVLLVLKMFALMYRGTGRSKYAYEMLHLIHNLTHVWLEELLYLVNPTGHPNGFIPVNLLQKHLNLYIKTLYKAHGSNALWEWLKIISPYVIQLQKLATQMHEVFGSAQGSKHAPPDLMYDISCLMDSMRCIIKENKATVVDVLAVGAQQLIGPLADYNSLFECLRRHHHLRQVVGDPIPVLSDYPAVQAPAGDQSVSADETFESAPKSTSVQLTTTAVHKTNSVKHEKDEPDHVSTHLDSSSVTGTVVSRISLPVAPDGSDSSGASDEPLSDDFDDVKGEEQLPWEHLLDEPLKKVFSLNNEEDVNLYMY